MFQVIDIQKLKTSQEIKDVADHNLRQTASKNVDKDRTPNNRFYIGSPSTDTLTLLDEKLANVPKFRKDAVKVVQLVLSASPEFFNTKGAKDWERLTQKWLEDTFGKDNILYSTVHYDEKTPHFHCAIVPIYEGKLNASHWLDGKKKMQELHNSYNKVVKPLGLNRGRPAVKASQQNTEEFYKKVNASKAYEDKLDKKLDKILEQKSLNPYTQIKNLGESLRQMAKSLSHYRTKAKNTDEVKKELEYYRQSYGEERAKVLKYTKMLKQAGISPEATTAELELYKPHILEIREKATPSKPVLVEMQDTAAPARATLPTEEYKGEQIAITQKQVKPK